MHPQLATIVEELRAAQARLHRLAGRLAPEQWTARPDPKRWSVAECVEHLNLTARAFVPLIERGLAEGTRAGGPAPTRFRRDFLGWLLWATMPPPVRFRVPTTPAFLPTADRPPAELLADFDRLQEEQIALVRSAEGVPLQKIRIPSPFNERVSYNAYSALSILAPHQERHIWQAERAVT